jgi:ligand-binding sensor domain-containing protein
MQCSSLHLCRQLLDYFYSTFAVQARRALLTAVVLVLCLFAVAGAQSVSDRHWVTFRQPDGLASNSTLSILTHDGAIWVGTAHGVSRYNGAWHSFTSLPASNTTESKLVQFGKVTALATDLSTGVLWAGTEAGLLARWDEGNGWTLDRMVEGRIHALAAAAGSLWIASDFGLMQMRNDVLEIVPELSASPVYSLACIDDVVWAGAQHTLWRLSPDTGIIEGHTPKDARGHAFAGPFTALWPASSAIIWVGTKGAIFEYFSESAETLQYPFPFENSKAEITDIAGSEADSIWVTSNNGGAAQFRLADREIASVRNWGGAATGGLTTDNVYGVVTDADGSVWFATAVGVYRYQPWAFQEVGERLDSLPVNDLLFDRLGNLWVATAGEGIQVHSQRYRQPAQHFMDSNGLPGGIVYALHEDESGRIWAATSRGVSYYEGQRWYQPLSLRNLQLSPASKLRSDSVGIWIGTPHGVHRFRFADQSVIVEAPTQGEPINTLEFDSIGRLWVAGANGQVWLRTLDLAWSRIEPSGENFPDSAPVMSFYPEAQPPGSMLAAFKGLGLYRYQNATWEAIDSSRRWDDDRVFALKPEPANNSIWIGGMTGLSRIDAYGIIRFDSQDGIQPGAVRTIAQDESGNYWFGGDRGLSIYTPEKGKPWVQVATIKGAEPGEQDDVWRTLTDTSVEVTFIAGDLQTLPGKMELFTRLLSDEDESTGWQPLASKTHQTSFTEPGRYTLEYMIRDQAMNYSPVNSIDLLVSLAPTYFSIPILGRVESRVFQLLVLFASLAVFGFGFVSFEILQHRRRIGEAVARGYNPYISGEPVRREDMFFGRHELLERIVSTLHNNSIMIHGERRIGKTTLLYQLANTLRQIDDHDYWFVALYVDLEGTTEETFFHLLMEEIVHHLTSLDQLDSAQAARLATLAFHTAPPEQYTDREFSRDLRHIIEVLEAHGARHHPNRQVRLILLMDEMDTLSRFDHLIQQQLRRIFMRDFAASLGAVVAGIEISKDWERVESPWFNLFNEIAMMPFSRQESIALLVEPVRGYYIYEPEALDFILDQSEGRPYRLQQYAMESVNEMLRHKRRRITQRDALAAHTTIQANSQLGIVHSNMPQTEPFSMASATSSDTA